MVDQKREVSRIPVDKVSPGHMEAELKASIREFEQRYEIASSDMLHCISIGVIRETGEILKWMFDYRVLQHLQEQIPTAGIPGITIEPSTKTS